MIRAPLPLILAAVLSLFTSSSAWSSHFRDFPRTYDLEIRQAATRWWPGVPWKLWKAQLYQESRLDPAAVSPVGAAGLAQFMPGTWAEVATELKLGAVPRSAASQSINAGAYYMAKLRTRWAGLAEWDRHKLAQASYNAGAGNTSRAKRLCDAETWSMIAPCLEAVTGRHSAETLTYVERIWHWYETMERAR